MPIPGDLICYSFFPPVVKHCLALLQDSHAHSQDSGHEVPSLDGHPVCSAGFGIGTLCSRSMGASTLELPLDVAVGPHGASWTRRPEKGSERRTGVLGWPQEAQ